MRILHIDFMGNGSAYWGRTLSSMCDLYVFLPITSNIPDMSAALNTKPTHIVCGGGFYAFANDAQEQLQMLSHYKQNNNVAGFSYYGDGGTDLQSMGFYMQLYLNKIVDVIFCSSDDAVNVCRENGIKSEYKPHPVPDLFFNFNQPLPLIWDWCFTGNHQSERHKIISLAKTISSNCIIRGLGHKIAVPQSSYEETAIIYRHSKIVLNITISECISLSRYFSDRLPMALCGGRFCLTNYQKNLEMVFKRGKHLDWYSSEDELKDKMIYYINNDNVREEIAKNGYFLAKDTFTMKKLLSYFLATAEKINNEKTNE